jgi:caffeoyl-CoA O-methyltransferase
MFKKSYRSMAIPIVSEAANLYATEHTSVEPPLLRDINEWTLANHSEHRMLSGQIQGRFLEMISKLVQPRRILEIGTFTGYSGLCLAEGLAPGGQLHTLELRSETAEVARNFFNKSHLRDQIILHTGIALDIIPVLNETWDIIFIDADKPNYIPYYELTLPGLRKGGLIIADNVLFHGEVLEENINGKNALALNAFNNHIKNDPRVTQVMLTVRDGLMLIQKN